MKVNHLNYPDNNGSIYCKQKNSVVTLDPSLWRTCFRCPYFNGTYQGEGVECLYEDNVAENFIDYSDNAQYAYRLHNG